MLAAIRGGRVRPRGRLALRRRRQHRRTGTGPTARRPRRSPTRSRARLTGVELTDPMSGYFMLRTETAAARRAPPVGHRLQDPARHPRHGRHAAAGQGIPARLRRARARAKASSTAPSCSSSSSGSTTSGSGGSSRRASRCSARSARLGVVVHMAVLSAFLAAVRRQLRGPAGLDLRGRPDARRAGGDDLQLRAQQRADLSPTSGCAAPGRCCSGWLRFALTCSVGAARQCRRRRGAGALGLPRLPGGARRDRDRLGVELRAVEPLRLGPLLALSASCRASIQSQERALPVGERRGGEDRPEIGEQRARRPASDSQRQPAPARAATARRAPAPARPAGSMLGSK